MKRIFAVIAEFFLFLLLNLLGGVFYHPFHIETTLAPTQLATRSFVWDGVLLMLLAWVALVLFAALRKRFAESAPRITIALALAALAGFFLKVGFVTHNW